MLPHKSVQHPGAQFAELQTGKIEMLGRIPAGNNAAPLGKSLATEKALLRV
jgi:hypothetical protein